MEHEEAKKVGGKTVYAITIFILYFFFIGPMDIYCFFLVVTFCANTIFFATSSREDRGSWALKGFIAAVLAIVNGVVLIVTRVNHNDDHEKDGGRKNMYYITLFSTVLAVGSFLYYTVRDYDSKDGRRRDEEKQLYDMCAQYSRRYSLSMRQVRLVMDYRNDIFPESFFDSIVAATRNSEQFKKLSPLEQENALMVATSAGVEDIETGRLKNPGADFLM